MKSKKKKSQNHVFTNNQDHWFSTYELLEYLCISKEELEKKTSELTEGIHYKKVNGSLTDGPFLWRIDLVDELLCLPVAPLEKEAMLQAINNHIICSR